MMGKIESSRECLFFDALKAVVKSAVSENIPLHQILRVVEELVKRIKQDSEAHNKQCLCKCFHTLR
mgnify:CR=1 FL=1